MLISTSTALRPKVIHDLEHLWHLPLWLLLCLTPVLIVNYWVKDPIERRKRRTEWLVVSVFIPLLLSILLPSLASARSEISLSADAIKVLSAQRIGSYDVRVLKAASADDLSAWLAENKLQKLPPRALPLVADYIKRGWCFAVARIQAADGQSALPHPLAVTFPAERAVFPMMLTSLAGGTTRVELVVASNQRTEADGFHLVCCDQFTGSSDSYDGSSTRLIVGSPDVRKFLWNGCTLSKLTADLEPAQMASDIFLKPTSFASHRDTLWSTRGRTELIYTIMGTSLLLAALFFSVACYGRQRPDRSTKSVLLGIGGGAVLAVAIAYLVLPVVEVRTGGPGGIVGEILRRANFSSALCPYAAELQKLQDQLPARVIEIIAQSPNIAANEILGGPVRWERSPGNINISTNNGRAAIVTYNIDGQEQVVLVLK